MFVWLIYDRNTCICTSGTPEKQGIVLCIMEIIISVPQLSFLLLLRKFYVCREKLFNDNKIGSLSIFIGTQEILTVEHLARLKENSYEIKFKLWENYYQDL